MIVSTPSYADCPVCGGRVSRRGDGQLRVHQDQRHELYGVGRGAEVPTCPGTGCTISEAELVATREKVGERE